jgi:uncharacterized protein YggE
MAISITPTMRGALGGAAAAGLLIGSFLLGTAHASTAGHGTNASAAMLASASDGKITVTGNGVATGKPNQLVLTMGVQVNSYSVTSAVAEANAAQRRVISALKAHGVAAADIQTANFSIQPNYRGSSQVPVGYNVSEQITANLNHLGSAGSQIQAAVNAGGNATTVDGVSLNLTDTGPLLRSARANAIHDAQAKANAYAAALGEHVTGVVSISDQTQVTPIFQSYGLSAAVPAPSRVPISPGKQQVSAQITVVFSIA